MSIARPLFVVAGVGAGSGTGASCSKGYSVALIARNKESLDSLATEINNGGGNAASFPIPSYAPSDIETAFKSIYSKFPSPEYVYRTGLFNAGHGVWKPFLQIPEADVVETMNTNYLATWAFSRETIKKFKENPEDERTGKGTLIFTGATASLRGNVVTSAFSAAKHAMRGLSQSLAKEFGKENIHFMLLSTAKLQTGNQTRLGQAPAEGLKPESIAESYLWLANQDKTTWTWELDLRPSFEKW
ncbi:NAD-P-binding protein [Flagelloscypha sp. PMI_526]|nr:NAD-P-binding protein [Flagelloscypha sp. PMI_526]